jgi:hypothetical protein
MGLHLLARNILISVPVVFDNVSAITIAGHFLGRGGRCEYGLESLPTKDKVFIELLERDKPESKFCF